MMQSSLERNIFLSPGNAKEVVDYELEKCVSRNNYMFVFSSADISASRDPSTSIFFS